MDRGPPVRGRGEGGLAHQQNKIGAGHRGDHRRLHVHRDQAVVGDEAGDLLIETVARVVQLQQGELRPVLDATGNNVWVQADDGLWSALKINNTVFMKLVG